jgi:hypothetical protein
MRKTLLTGLALAVAIAVLPLPELQAATFVHPGSQPAMDNLTIEVKAKKKAKGKKGKKAKKGKGAKGPGGCGTYMYWSKKTGKCEDARNKK